MKKQWVHGTFRGVRKPRGAWKINFQERKRPEFSWKISRGEKMTRVPWILLHIKISHSLPITTLFYNFPYLYRSTSPFHQSKMHLTSALSLLTVIAFAVQLGNACTAKECTKLVRELKHNKVPFCGSKIAKCPKDFGYSTADPNTSYTFSHRELRKKEKCVAPLKCIDSPTGATCGCEQTTGRIFIPGSKQCWDAPYLDVVRSSPIHLFVHTSSPALDLKIANPAFIH